MAGYVIWEHPILQGSLQSCDELLLALVRASLWDGISFLPLEKQRTLTEFDAEFVSLSDFFFLARITPRSCMTLHTNHVAVTTTSVHAHSYYIGSVSVVLGKKGSCHFIDMYDSSQKHALFT